MCQNFFVGALVSDGFSGAIITWVDRREGGTYDQDIYAQWVDADGDVQWTSNGEPISTGHTSLYEEYVALLSDGSGGAFITWNDGRDDDGDIYAQRVFSNGALAGVTTATGTGIATFTPSSGIIEDLEAVAEGTLPPEGKPALEFPHGFFSFNITGLTPCEHQTATVTITLPEDVPEGTQYWKYHEPEGWIDVTSLLGDDDGDNILTLTLTDGGLGDDDGECNGVIVDQGGPAPIYVHNINTGEGFSTIQAAINDGNTDHGHTIRVDPGTYTENVNVTKQLTIESTSGDPTNTTVQAASSSDHVFEVTANYVNITGFTVEGATGSGRAGIYLYSSSNSNVSGNTCSNNYYGIGLDGSSDNNSVSGNTCSNNTYRGIYLLSSSNDNTIYLNTFSNTSNVYSYGSTNTWCSPTELGYLYDGSASTYKNYMGNRYSGYGGADGDGDGIGNTPYDLPGSEPDDNYPLMDSRNNYTLLAWFLGNPTMYKDDMTRGGGAETIGGGSLVVWVADAAAEVDLTFPAGDEGQQTSWTYQITFTTAPASGQSFTLNVGYAESDGSNFHAGGPQVTLSGDNSKKVFSGATNAQSFAMSSGKYLALRITSSDGADRDVRVGGSWSYCSASQGSPDYPLHVELSSFTAIAGDGQVTLRWTTESEIDNLGFYVYRSLAEDSPYDRITADLIEGAGTASNQNTYTFTDPNVSNGITYWYKLEDVDFDGTRTLHGPVAATPQAKAQEIEQPSIPDRYDLSVNVPNPFNPQTTLAYQLPEASEVRLTIYNTAGQVIRTLVEGRKEAGWYQVVWDSVDDAGKPVAAGVYLYELKAGDFVKARKMALIR